MSNPQQQPPYATRSREMHQPWKTGHFLTILSV